MQAIQDATMRISERRIGYAREQLEAVRRQARNWIKLQGEDFRLVCELAGLEAQRVHQFAMAKVRESIDAERERATSEILGGSMPGVVPNFLKAAPDRHASDPRESAEIGFLNQNENPSRDESLSVVNSGDLAAAEVKL